MANKNLYYPPGFQEQVNALIEALKQRGVDLRNKKLNLPSESLLFRYLVEQELKRLTEAPK